jgi:poly-gamma-glutamate synthesis protein (capsule biosynthesis protein)
MSTAASGVLNHVIGTLAPQDAALIDTSSAQDLLPLRRENQPFLDIRGVGDSGDTGNQATRAPKAAFGSFLDRFNANGLLYRGDVNVINWESVVGERCDRYGSSFGFLSSPAAILQAFDKGFQVFALSNNHSRDCNSTPEGGAAGDGLAGEVATFVNMEKLAVSRDILWNGVHGRQPRRLVTTKEFDQNGRVYTMAYSSLDLGRESCPGSNCYGDRRAIADALARTTADVKVVSIHSREWLGSLSVAQNLAQLNKIQETARLLIERGDADVVFGTGPHIAMPVRAFRQADGGTGVAFFSLGNFIHQLLSAQQPNLIGRVLFDLETRRPVQLQGMMVSTVGESATIQNFNPASPFVKGLPWLVGVDPSTGVRVGYINLMGR